MIKWFKFRDKHAPPPPSFTEKLKPTPSARKASPVLREPSFGKVLQHVEGRNMIEPENSWRVRITEVPHGSSLFRFEGWVFEPNQRESKKCLYGETKQEVAQKAQTYKDQKVKLERSEAGVPSTVYL